MGAVRRACALALILAGGAQALPAVNPREDARPDAEKYFGGIEARIRELNDLLGRLFELQKEYSRETDLDALRPRRESLLNDIRSKRTQLDDLEEGFKRIRKLEQFYLAGQIISQKIIDKDKQPSNEDLERMVRVDGFSRKIDDAKAQAMQALALDENLWRTEEAGRSERRNRILAACALALAATILYWASRRRRKRKALAAAPVEAPEAAEDPASHGLIGGPRTPRPAPVTVSGPDSIGTVVGGNYRIESHLGRGALGAAFEAYDLERGIKVALRRIREEVQQSEKETEVFLSRARASAALKHANIAEIYSVFLENGRIYMVSEFCPGKPLSQFLDEGKRISLRSVKGVLQQAAAAVDHAHSKGIVHGDLKPSNLILSFQGAVKVLDFGIALQVKRTLAKLSWAQALGNPPYMAPEQELGAVTGAADLYSLGVMLYEMATGRPPFEGPNFLAQKREMLFKPPTQLVAGLPKGLDVVMQKALHAEPKSRFQAAMDLFGALAALPEHTPRSI
jgi:hypothetical protein